MYSKIDVNNQIKQSYDGVMPATVTDNRGISLVSWKVPNLNIVMLVMSPSSLSFCPWIQNIMQVYPLYVKILPFTRKVTLRGRRKSTLCLSHTYILYCYLHKGKEQSLFKSITLFIITNHSTQLNANYNVFKLNYKVFTTLSKS